MINGAHIIIYSKDPEADKRFFKELGFPQVDVGHGWLIFGLPPAEVAFHPGEHNNVHEFYLMVEDIEAFVQQMKGKNIPCRSINDQGWGLLVELSLPGGGKLGVYQPRHSRPEPALSVGKI